jgi:integrase
MTSLNRTRFIVFLAINATVCLLDSTTLAHAQAKAAGVPGAIPYDLRRTVARNRRAAGTPERVIMEITGHKTRSMFDRYGIVDERDIRSAF